MASPSFALPDGWSIEPGVDLVVVHSTPHAVVSQVIRPDVAAFLPASCVLIQTEHDARHFATTLSRTDPSTPFSMSAERARCFPHVTALDLTDCSLDTPLLARIAELDSGWSNGGLRSLFLKRCRSIDVRGFVKVGKMTQIRCLNVSCCTRLGAGGIAVIAYGLSQLRWLDVSLCPEVDADAMVHISRLRHLQTLRLRWCHSVDAEALSHVPALVSLETLDLSSCASIDADGLSHVAGLPRLETLLLSRCDGVDAEGLAHLSKMPCLRALRLGECDHVDDESLECIAAFPQLAQLDLIGCCNVDAFALEHLSNTTLLRVLDVRCCRNVNTEALAHVRHVPTVLCSASTPEICNAAWRAIDAELQGLPTQRHWFNCDLLTASGAVEF